MANDIVQVGIVYYEEGGERYRRYPSGVIQRLAEDGRWHFAPGTAKRGDFAPGEDARSAINARWEAMRDAAMAGIIEGTQRPTDLDAVSALAAAATEHAMAGGAGGAAYLQQVRQMAGLSMPDNAQPRLPGQTPLTLDGVRDLLAVVEAEVQRRTTEPRIVINDPMD